MISCERCGASLECVERRGHMVRYRCSRCGTELAGTVSYVHELPRPTWVTVAVRWQGASPSARELRVLRQLFPELASRPLSAFAAEGGSQPLMHIGRRVEEHARELQATAAGQGVALVLVVE